VSQKSTLFSASQMFALDKLSSSLEEQASEVKFTLHKITSLSRLLAYRLILSTHCGYSVTRLAFHFAVTFNSVAVTASAKLGAVFFHPESSGVWRGHSGLVYRHPAQVKPTKNGSRKTMIFTPVAILKCVYPIAGGGGRFPERTFMIC
jgi:hypothetical protein